MRPRATNLTGNAKNQWLIEDDKLEQIYFAMI